MFVGKDYPRKPPKLVSHEQWWFYSTTCICDLLVSDITRMTKLLGRPSKQRQVDVDEESEDQSYPESLTDVEKSENQGEELRVEEGREGQPESPGPKTDNNQTILRILGEGEKV